MGSRPPAAARTHSAMEFTRPPTGTTTLRAALTGRARSWPGRRPSPTEGAAAAAVVRIQGKAEAHQLRRYLAALIPNVASRSRARNVAEASGSARARHRFGDRGVAGVGISSRHAKMATSPRSGEQGGTEYLAPRPSTRQGDTRAARRSPRRLGRSGECSWFFVGVEQTGTEWDGWRRASLRC
jgi:hypothetical protein